ncbi:MAG: hypothetical protein WA782_16770 [Sulfitobacter sp.]
MAALILVIGTFPLWFIIAVFWGLVKGGIAFAGLLVVFFGQQTIEWIQIWTVPLGAIVAGVKSAWDIPSNIWAWGKFSHPVWAAIIGLVFIAGGRGAQRG